MEYLENIAAVLFMVAWAAMFYYLPWLLVYFDLMPLYSPYSCWDWVNEVSRCEGGYDYLNDV